MPVSSSRSNGDTEAPDDLYRAVWRWHFYAGLAVAPILLVLASTGLVMLSRAPLEAALYGHLLTVEPGIAQRTPAAQLAAVQAAFPAMQPILFVPPAAPDRASEFAVAPPLSDARTGRRVVAGMFVCALVFPLSAAAIVVVLLLDRVLTGLQLGRDRHRARITPS